MRLFHFSDRGDITFFVPRPVQIRAERAFGMEWLNDPLVWAIDEWHQPLYLFPRECPRVLIWRLATTTPVDWAAWSGGSTARMVAFIEVGSAELVRTASIHRYEVPPKHFHPLEDAGMWVSKRPAKPTRHDVICDLPAELHAQNVELRIVNDLAALRTAWSSTLHVSGIRLRNAKTW